MALPHPLTCPPIHPPMRRDHARGIAGKAQLFVNAFAKALEVVPRQLADNSGFDATDVLNKLRQRHAAKDGSGANIGIDVNTGGWVGGYM